MSAPKFYFGRYHQAKPNARCCGKPRGCNMPKDGCLYVVKRERIETGRDPALSVHDYRRNRGLCVTCGAGPCGSCTCNHSDCEDSAA